MYKWVKYFVSLLHVLNFVLLFVSLLYLPLFCFLYLQLTSKIAASATAPVEPSDDGDDDDSSVQPSQPPTTTPTPSVTRKFRAKSGKGLEDEVLLAAIGPPTPCRFRRNSPQ